jgi:hypothetical protein
VAIVAGTYHFLALQNTGTPIAWNYNGFGQASPPVGLVGNVVALAAGFGHSMALLTNGTVVAWGDNNDGETNVPSNATNIVAIVACNEHSLALTFQGTVIGWGTNTYGLNAPPANATNAIAIADSGDACCALRADGSLVCWGNSGYGETTPPANATNIVALYSPAACATFLAAKADGTVVGWGYNGWGQTTPPANATNLLSVALGSTQCLGIRAADGAVIIWGNDTYAPTNVVPGLNILSNAPFIVGSVDTTLTGSYPIAYTAQTLFGTEETISRTVEVLPQLFLAGTMNFNGQSFQISFSNLSGLNFNILATTNLALPLSAWQVVGSAQEISPGQYRFTDSRTPGTTQQFYTVHLQ